MDYCEDPARSCKHLNFPANLHQITYMLLRRNKATFQKSFGYLTTLVSQEVERSCLGRKTKI